MVNALPIDHLMLWYFKDGQVVERVEYVPEEAVEEVAADAVEQQHVPQPSRAIQRQLVSNLVQILFSCADLFGQREVCPPLNPYILMAFFLRFKIVLSYAFIQNLFFPWITYKWYRSQ